MPEFCVPLTAVRAGDLAVAGGKGANLGELIAAGFDVPDGFIVTTGAYRAAVGPGPHEQAAIQSLKVPSQIATTIAEAYAALGSPQVAVRSSATAEDLPGAAFAGQQDTYLGVVGEPQVIEAVRDCWASLWTPRAISYRDRLGVDEARMAIAVVVQRLVPADYAGVMFTADPVTGARDRVVIDANPGLGEAVVAGLVTPDHAVLSAAGVVLEHRAGRREVVINARPDGGTATGTGASTPSLDDATLARLAAVGRSIAGHFGTPQDIEWAIAGQRIAIVQARPMTALPPPPVPVNAFQRMIGPVILELLPRRPYPMEVSAWIGAVGRHLQGLISGIAGARVRFDGIVVSDDAVVNEYRPPNPHPTPHTPLRLLRALLRIGRDPRAWRDDPRYAGFRADTDALAALNLTTAQWTDLLAVPARAEDLMTTMTGLRVDYLPPAAGAMIRLRLLLTALGLTRLFAALLLESPTETAAANDALDGIADAVRAAPGLARRLVDTDPHEALAVLRTDAVAQPARRRFDAFLTRYGHRETGSILLLRDPSWADDPAVVMALVQVLLASDHGTGAQPFAPALATLLAHPLVRSLHAENAVRRLVTRASAGVQVREDTHFELSRAMPPVRHAVLEAGRRLAAAGLIDAPDDVWFLTWPQLQALPDPAATPSEGAALRASIDRRKTAWQQLAGSPLIATATMYPRRDDAEALVTGAAGGGGRAEGLVRVIHGPAEFGDLQPGEVLVCPATNPSWTPLFTRAAAVVVDHGGLASHAAIVAREYGIPAVMGTGDGTSVLVTGSRVIVDGDRGRVLSADDAAA